MNITVTLPLSPKVLDFLKSFTGPSPETLKQLEAYEGPLKEDEKKKMNAPSAANELQEKKELKIEDIRKIVIEKKHEGKEKNVRKLLADYGTESVTLLSPEKYSDFYKQLTEL